MLNKIKVIGKILPLELKEKSTTQELLVYFSLIVVNPNEARTVLRCHASGKVAIELEKEAREGEMVEVRGYLRNEKEGRQIIVRVQEFTKLENIENVSLFNQARLLGKVVTDLEISRKSEDNSKIVSFKVEIPTKENKLNAFFCRAQGELALEITNQVKKRDVILLEGFLQTKKVNSGEDIYPEKVVRISSFICQSFVRLDTATVSDFYS